MISSSSFCCFDNKNWHENSTNPWKVGLLQGVNRKNFSQSDKQGGPNMGGFRKLISVPLVFGTLEYIETYVLKMVLMSKTLRRITFS